MRGIAMSEAEVDAFLNEHAQLYLATVSENGWPHVAPVAFASASERDRLYVLTHPGQRKSRNIFHDNRVGLVVDDGDSYATLRGVFAHGYATVVRDRARMAELERRWVDQCYDGALPDIVKKVYSRRDGWIWFEIDLAHVVSWDNTKVDPERLADQDVPSGMPFTYAVPDDAGAAEPGHRDR